VRRSAEGATHLALGIVASLSIIAGVALVATSADGLSWWDRWVGVLLSWSYTGAGLVAWWRRPHNRFGPMLVATGVAFLLFELTVSQSSTLLAISLVTATLPLAMVLHLLMAFPSGRLQTAAEEAVVWTGYLLAIVLQAPQYLLSEGRVMPELLSIAPEQEVADAVRDVQSVVGTVIYLVGTAILVARLRTADAAQRRNIWPLAAVGSATLIAVAAVGFMATFEIPWSGFQTLADVIQPALVLVLPLAFLFGLLRGGFARAGELRELAARIASADASPGELRDAIASALGDPTVELAYWSPSGRRYVDALGAPVALPAPGGSRAAVTVVGDGQHVGAIAYDALLISDVELVRSIARLTALALDRQRLTAELRAAAGELRLSRQRLVVASDEERRRIARDLHDGVQPRLVLLGMDAQRLARAADDGDRVRTEATRLREEVEFVIDDLRDMVHRIQPALLTERGLHDAVAWLVARMPMPTGLETDGIDGRLPPVVESIGYFVVSEALANVVKHAAACSAEVELQRTADRVAIVVRDDGVGGAELRTDSGAGLRGIADRVAAVGGTLSLTSRPGAGTTLRADVPLA